MKRYIKSAISNIHDDDERSKIDLAESSYISSRDLSILAEDYDEYVREAVARRPNLPIEVQEKLSNDALFCVRRALAGNPTISLEIMEKLASEDKWQVPQALAFNPSVPEYLLRKLVDIVPESVAWNPNTPLDVLLKLRLHEDPEIREAAVRSLKLHRGEL